jgi:hypothetical protein
MTNLNGPELLLDQGEATSRKATDQSYIPIYHSLYEKVKRDKIAAENLGSTNLDTAVNWRERLSEAGIDKQDHSQFAIAYDIYWQEFRRAEAESKSVVLRRDKERRAARLEEERIAAERKEETERRELMEAILFRPDIDDSLRTNLGLQVGALNPGTNDYVSKGHLKPSNWWEGIDCHVGYMPRSYKTPEPQKQENAPIAHKVKHREGDSIAKAHAIAGYLKRRMLKAGTKAKAIPNNKQNSILRASQDAEGRRDPIPTINRFALVEDELAHVVESGTQEEEVAGRGDQVQTVAKKGSVQSGNRKSSAKASAAGEDIEMMNGEVTCSDGEQETNVVGAIPPGQSTTYHQVDPPSFSKARALRDKKSRITYTALTYYLKCKHYMHVKDPHFVRTLVQDARAWLLRGQFKMETYQEYVILTSAVMSAFFVDQEELHFRSRMKNRKEWQALDKHNRACNGDLGWRFGQVEPRFKALRHVFQSRVRLPVANGLSA